MTRRCRSKPVHKVDIPAFDWPISKFPRYMYPLEKHEGHNQKQDEACLENVRQLIESRKKENRDVAVLIVEPIQSEGGDHYASPQFFQGLQKICQEHGIAFIVDEVGCCGSMGLNQNHNLTFRSKPAVEPRARSGPTKSGTCRRPRTLSPSPRSFCLAVTITRTSSRSMR